MLRNKHYDCAATQVPFPWTILGGLFLKWHIGNTNAGKTRGAQFSQKVSWVDLICNHFYNTKQASRKPVSVVRLFFVLHVLEVLHGPVERLPHDLVAVDGVVAVLHGQEVVVAVRPAARVIQSRHNLRGEDNFKS